MHHTIMHETKMWLLGSCRNLAPIW